MSRKKRQTRTEFLNERLMPLIRSEHGDLRVEFIPFQGWFLVGEPRWFGDDGREYIAADWRTAAKVLPMML